MKKIRVVHILHSFKTGGMEKGVATIIRHASESFDHILLCLSTSGEFEQHLPSGTRVLELNKPLGNSLLFIAKLARTIRSLKPDVVHTRNWGGMDGIIASRLAGIKAVVHGEHGWEMNDPNGLNLRRLIFRRFLSRWVSEYTCVSKHIKQWLLSEIGVKRVVTQIYNGVDTKLYHPSNEKNSILNELGIPQTAFKIGVVGRLDPIKDHPTLFNAFKKMNENCYAARLLVIGDGSERTRLEEIAGNGIYFLGNRADIADIMRILDIFVLPSRNEGISNTILEAMATGLPVIATSVGGNPELVKDGLNGMLVPPGEANAMSSALLQYHNNPGLQKEHGKMGRKRILEMFSIDSMVRNYETVYQRMASR